MALKQHLPPGASYELRRTRAISSDVAFRGGRFERIESADRASTTLRLQQNGKLSVATSSKPNSDLELLQQALATVPYGSAHDIPFVSEAEVKALQLVDEAVMDENQKVALLAQIVAELKEIDARLNVSAGISASRNKVELETSLGFQHSYEKTVWRCNGSVELVQGEDRLRLGDSITAMGPHFDIKTVKDEVVKLLGYAKDVVPMESGTYPVIFAPSEVGNVLNPVVASLNGLAVARKVSPFIDKLGQQVLDPRITLIDDGSIDQQWTSVPFDAEGTPTKKNTLVQNGVLGDLLLDRKTAAALGKESSGNAGERGAAPHHLQLSTGSKTFMEMVASIPKGVIIYSTMGAWSGNAYAGVVTGTISMGLKIENGKIVGRIKDCMFSVNTFQHMLHHFIDTSSEADLAGTRQGPSLFPYLLLDEVVISTK